MLVPATPAGNSTHADELQLTAWSDGDLAADTVTRRSMTGVTVALGTTVLYNRSCKQSVVALSTSESELLASVEAAKILQWFERVRQDLLLPPSVPHLYTDCSPALSLMSTARQTRRTRHLDARHLWIRDLIQENRVSVSHFPTASNLADIHTKPLPRSRFLKLRPLINVIPRPDRSTA